MRKDEIENLIVNFHSTYGYLSDIINIDKPTGNQEMLFKMLDCEAEYSLILLKMAFIVYKSLVINGKEIIEYLLRNKYCNQGEAIKIQQIIAARSTRIFTDFIMDDSDSDFKTSLGNAASGILTKWHKNTIAEELDLSHMQQECDTEQHKDMDNILHN